MRRWNGWGEESVIYPLPHSAKEYLETQVGIDLSLEDAGLVEALASFPAARLPGHALISTLPTDHLIYARGQSLPDGIALRSGQIRNFPDGVAFLSDESARFAQTLMQAGFTGCQPG